MKSTFPSLITLKILPFSTFRELPLLFLFCPFLALFNSCTMRVISVLRVKGIIVQHLTRDIRAFSTMKETFILTTDGYRTFTMKWMSVCCNTTAAPSSLSEHAIDTAKTTSCINYTFLIKLLFYFKPPLILSINFYHSIFLSS